MPLSKKALTEAIDNIIKEYSENPVQREQELDSWGEIDKGYKRDASLDDVNIELDKNMNVHDIRDNAHSYAMDDPMYKKVTGTTLRDRLKAQFGNNIQTEGKKMFKNNQGYSHFAVSKKSGKIVNGWDYKDYDPEELKEFKKDYFDADMRDYGFNPKDFRILSYKYLVRNGINPDDNSNWANNDEANDEFVGYDMQTENKKNMSKKLVRLSENDIHNIIRESVRSILNEYYI